MGETIQEFARRYVWQPVVRWYHWINVLCMLVLAVTGLYIGNPFVTAEGVPFPYVMGWMRFAHYVAATVLALILIVRFYWAFVGNRYARWGGVLPLNKVRGRDVWRQFKYYVFLSSDRPPYVGHNPVAGLSYILLWLLVLIQGFTGLALNAAADPGGFWWFFFGWTYALVSPQWMRLVHHWVMWFIIIFSMVHLYMAILADVEERDGAMTSMVSGFKWPHFERSVEDEIAEGPARQS